MPMLSARRALTPLQVAELPCLTNTPPLKTCQISIVIPVRNEAQSLPTVLNALTHQVDIQGRPLDPDRYEVLLLANNCSDDSAAIAQAWSKAHPAFNLHLITVTLPSSQACIGYARRLVMNEAYRRLTMVPGDRTIIASTDGDTEVATTWLAALLEEFDQDVEMVCGRIFTRRSAALGIPAKTSLYFLRYMAHRYLTAQLEGLLDPLPHDCWPRHYQHFGANMAVLAKVYGQVGGMPDVRTQEDVAFYRRLQQIDAKIRHSPRVRVMTSARRVGRTSGGLAERLNQLTQAGQQRQAVFVETPQLTEARILMRHQLRQLWMTQHGSSYRNDAPGRLEVSLVAQYLGISDRELQHELATAPTFGLLLEAMESQQHNAVNNFGQYPTVEISLAIMHLRQRLQELRQQRGTLMSPLGSTVSWLTTLETLKQIQPIPLFSLTY